MEEPKRILVQYADRFRLWQEFVLASDRDGKVFIPCEVKETPGAEVILEVQVGRSEPLQVRAEVESRRPPSTRFARGLYVVLEHEEVETLRAELGLMGAAAADSGGRRERRYHFRWRVDFRTPALLKPVETLDISASGMHVHMPERVRRGHVLEFRLNTSQGHDLQLAGTVMWTSETSNRVGVRFLFKDEDGERAFRGVLEHAALAEEHERVSGPLPEHRVLVADDDKEILEMISRALTRRRYLVSRASSGEEALSLIRQERPDVVLLDIRMPRMDGETVCRSVREDADLTNLPIVLISALEEDELQKRAERSGATTWLQKPVRPRLLLELIEKLIAAAAAADSDAPSDA
jgi:CheY-like chemotaxis protein